MDSVIKEEEATKFTDLDDYASPETKEKGERIIKKEIEEIREKLPDIFPKFMEYYKKIESGKRDLYF